MKVYTGVIEDMGRLTGRSGRGGVIEFIIINGETIRRVRCADDVFSFMKIGMNTTLYVHSIPVLGKLILGVKDMGNNRKFMARNIEVLASCFLLVVMLAFVFILPAYLIGMWWLAIIVPVIISVMLYLDYMKASAAG